MWVCRTAFIIYLSVGGRILLRQENVQDANLRSPLKLKKTNVLIPQNFMPHLLQPSKFVITNLKYLFVVMDQKPQHIYTVTLLINEIKLHVIL